MNPIRLFRTSSFRLTLLFAGLFGLCALVLFGAIEAYAVGSLHTELRRTVDSRLAAILEDGARSDSAALIRNVGDITEQNPGVYTLLLDTAGHRIAGNLPAAAPSLGWTTLTLPARNPTGAPDPHPVIGRGVRLADGGLLFVGQDAFSIDELRELIARAFALGGAITLVLALAGGFLVSRRVLHRVAVVGRAGQAIMYGDLSHRLPTRGTGDEFDQLVSGFNAMLDRIAGLMGAMRQVTDNIAHDLRTPLSRLRAKLERLQASQVAADDRRVTGEAIADADKLLDLFAALLRIAQVESASGGELSTLDGAALVDTVVELYLPLAEEQRQRIVANGRPVPLRADRELMIQMLANLVENACRHCPAGARIEVGSALRGDLAVLWVEDNGPGIPASEQENVFRRFYRMEASRSTAGTGLGLSLAAAIAVRHRGRITLRDAFPGLRAEISFPIG